MNVNTMLALGIMWEGNAWNLRCDGDFGARCLSPHEGGRPLAHHPARHSAQCAHGEDREKSFGVFRDTVLLGEGHEI